MDLGLINRRRSSFTHVLRRWPKIRRLFFPKLSNHVNPHVRFIFTYFTCGYLELTIGVKAVKRKHTEKAMPSAVNRDTPDHCRWQEALVW
jgi:hypothetical protein